MQGEQGTLTEKVIVRGSQGASYMVETLLGKGGFGAVYVVRDRRIKSKRYALKELIGSDKLDRDCFLFEGELLKRLDHPALPHVYSVFEYKKLQRVYMLMDYIQGRNLNELRKEQPEQRFSLPVVLALLAPVVEALTYLHSQDPPIIHRDIKPGNIIVSAGGNQTILVDFGTAKEYDSDATTSVVRQVTSGYAAPEQYMGGTNPRTDVYGLAATLYTLLSGQTPPDALVRATRKQGSDPLTSASMNLPAMPLSIVEIIRRAMSLSSDDRFESVAEFWQQIQAHAPQQQEQGHAELADLLSRPGLAQSRRELLTKSSRGRQPVLRKTPVLLISLLVLFLLAASGMGFFLRATGAPTVRRTPPQSRPATKVPATGVPNTSFYPPLAVWYNGTVGDLMTKEQSNLLLTGISQSGEQIHGSFQGLGLVGQFNGTVTTAGRVKFSVKIYAGQMTLMFDGYIKVGGDMAGSFAVLDGQGQHTGEAGIWNAAPPGAIQG